MPLPGLYPPFVTGIIVDQVITELATVVDLQAEYEIVTQYDVTYELVSEVGGP